MIQLKNINKLYVLESFNKVLALTEEECAELSNHLESLSKENEALVREINIFAENCSYYAGRCTKLEEENQELRAALRELRESSKRWVSFLRVPTEYHENRLPVEIVENFKTAMIRYKTTIDTYEKV